MEKSRMNLPKGPDTLCFDKDEFMKEDFDVDHFMSDCQKRVQLEALRDDLELYYKLLKTAMVELINKDYADFVNLSTNLICVLWLIQVIPSVEKIEKILNSQHSKETSALEASSEKGSTVPGYDFLVNSVWPEIVRELEEKLPLIFNSGNPDAFHQVGVICITEVVDISPGNLDSSLCFLQPRISHDILCISAGREVVGAVASVDGGYRIPLNILQCTGQPHSKDPQQRPSGSKLPYNEKDTGGLRGATPHSRSGGAAMRRYPSTKIRSSGGALLEHL
ncbi:conserved oligomeric Golgi complex subunit 2-like isoform 1-T1 [Dama dama]|uniref:conserved oligomeric Golgi complex subunit 2-like isoform X1 n=1 Tax=Dama dama TaxID=30532 RepID=UPI002A358E30|nr:conserved oligomeric Golgi complex subunit 2-like isoform X1 [Dama dama]